jgi:hypothetical protein
MLHSEESEDLQQGVIVPKIEQSIGGEQIQAIGQMTNSTAIQVNFSLESSYSRRKDNLVINSISTELERVSNRFSEEIESSKLTQIETLERRGKVQCARRAIQELRDSTDWKTFTASLQAKILRKLSGYAIKLDYDIASATDLLNQALELDPENNGSCLRALISYFSSGYQAALEEIGAVQDVDTLNCKLAILLEGSEFRKALEEIQGNSNIQLNAESYRLHALALLGVNDFDGAQGKISKALQDKPDWGSIRSTEAIITYCKSICTSGLPRRKGFPVPEPLELAFVKQDTYSLECLRKAEIEFSRLALETEWGEEVRQYWQVWQLACLANDNVKRSEAQKLCSQILKENPTSTMAILWAITRNYEIDWVSCQQELETSINNSLLNPDIEQITVLLYLYQHTKNPTEMSLKLLFDTKDVLSKTGYSDIWIFWHVLALADCNNSDIALKEIKGIENKATFNLAKANILKHEAQESGEWNPVVEHLEKSFNETNDINFLLDNFYIQSSLKNWSYILKHKDLLLERVATSTAVKIILDALWNTEQYELCLQLLRNSSDLFPNSKLPTHLKHLEVLCLASTGNISEALSEADVLVREDNKVEHLMTLLSMQFHHGDLQGLVVSARNLLQHEDTQPLACLQAASLIQLESRDLACKLWRKAVQTVDPECLGEVIDVGFRLSLDKEVRPFLHQAQLLALEGKGQLKAIELKEFMSLRKEWDNQSHEINQKYEKGEIPLHLLIELGNISFVEISRVLLQKNADQLNPHRQATLLTRYGGRAIQHRPFSEEFSIISSQCRLHFDISAFLLAAHLDIFELLERTFGKLRFSANLQPALMKQLQTIQTVQPSRLETYSQIIDIFNKKRIRELKYEHQLDSGSSHNSDLIEKMGASWVFLLEKAKTEDGYLVESFPLERINENGESEVIILDEIDKEKIIDCRALLESLKEENMLSEQQFNNFLDALRDQGCSPRSILPRLGSPIFLATGIAEALANANILDRVCKNFQIHMQHWCLEEARNAIETNNRRDEVINWLKKLIEYLRAGLESGNFELVSPESHKYISKVNKSSKLNLDFLSASDLFTFSPQENDIIWIDDRFFNKFLHRDGIPIITIVEILDALLVNQALSEDEYYSKLLQLRKMNVRYIPLSSDEAIYWVRQAQVQNGRVRETEELSILRRYISSCLLDTHRLDLPTIPQQDSPNPHGEIMFLLSCRHATESAIISGWTDRSISNERAEAYADWMFQNLYVGIFATRQLMQGNNFEDDINFLIAFDIAALYIIGGLHIVQTEEHYDDNKLSPRKCYFRWLNQYTEQRLKNNQELFKITSQHIQNFFKTSRKENLNEQSLIAQKKDFEPELENYLIRKILYQIYNDLPDLLVDSIQSDSDLMDWLGVKTVSSISVGTLHFSAEEFWHAAESSLNSGPAKIQDLESANNFELVSDVNKYSLEIRSEDALKKGKIQDSLIGVLSKDLFQKEEALRKQRYWFDCDNEAFQNISSEIVAIQDPSKRIIKAFEMREKSVSYFYYKFRIKLHQSHQISIDNLMQISVEGLIRHVRLDVNIQNGADFHLQLEKSAQTLISEEGIEEALLRLICLPVKMPSLVFDALNQLPFDQRITLIQKIDRRCASPICKLHLTAFLLSFTQEDSKVDRLLEKLFDDLYDEKAKEHFNLFSLLLQLVDNALSMRTNDINNWSAPIRLAVSWMHASQLQNIIDIPELILSDFIEILWNIVQQQMNADRLNRTPAYWNDVLHPYRIDNTVLTIHGLVRLLEDRPIALSSRSWFLERLQQLAIIESDGNKLPSPQFFRDSTLTTDSLDSILGGDRGCYLEPIIGSDLSQYIKSESLKSTVAGIIDKLENDPQEASNWTIVNTLVGDLPIYKELEEPLRKITRQINLADLYKINSRAAFLALEFISTQVGHIDNEFRIYLEKQIIGLAEILNNYNLEPIPINNNEEMARFIESIFKVSVQVNNPQATTTKASELLVKVLRVWPQLSDSHIYSALFKFIQELPAEQLHGFWTVFLHVRALRTTQTQEKLM